MDKVLRKLSLIKKKRGSNVWPLTENMFDTKNLVKMWLYTRGALDDWEIINIFLRI